MVDVAIARTSAAPVFSLRINLLRQGLFNGGVVGNAPGLAGFESSILPVNSPIDETIGTMSNRFRRDAKESLDKGALRWGEKLFSTFISDQGYVTEYCRVFLANIMNFIEKTLASSSPNILDWTHGE